MKKLLILLLLYYFSQPFFVLSGCASIVPNYGSVFSSDGNASISVPSGWNTSDTTITKVFPAAVIAASDTANQEYVAVIGVPKSYIGLQFHH